VRFYTYSPVHQSTIYRYEDKFTGPGMKFTSQETAIANGPGGIVF